MFENSRLYQKLRLQVEENPMQAIGVATAFIYAVSKFIDVVGLSAHAHAQRNKPSRRRR